MNENRGVNFDQVGSDWAATRIPQSSPVVLGIRSIPALKIET
jgi:hypothetical protein